MKEKQHEEVQVRKPKTKRGRRILRKKEPQVVEGVKKTLILKGNKSSETLSQFLKDIYQLKKEHTLNYSKKHDIAPFEDFSQVEKFCNSNDCSLFLFGSHSKKRPNNAIFGRMYEKGLLDMVELGCDNYKPLNPTKLDIPAQARPVLLFQGDQFETNSTFMRIKNLLQDFFVENQTVKNINVMKGLCYVISFSVKDEQTIYMRTYQTKVNKNKEQEGNAGINLEEVGPCADLSIRRHNLAADDLYKIACKQVKIKKKEGSKNIKYDAVGDKKGKLYVDHQDYNQLTLKKRKKLKVSEKKAKKLAEKEKETHFDL